MNTSELVIVTVLLLLVAGLFVLALAETSLLQVRRSAAEVEADAGDRQAAGLLDLLDDLPRVLNAVLLTVLLAQVSAATMAGELARDWFGGTGASIATATVTVVLFVYGEAVPKTIAVRNPFPVARRLAAPVHWLSTILRPIVSVLVRFADLQSRGSVRDTVTSVSEAELRLLADEAAEEGQIEESDAELIERSFDFGDLQVGEILVPRDRIVAVSSRSSVEDALQTAITAGHRRLLVHDGGIDHVIGFVRLRDLAAAVTNEPGAAVSTRSRAPLSVSADTPATELLRQMQRARCHMAVVEAPDASVEGIVTIEDVVEELVGTIEDT